MKFSILRCSSGFILEMNSKCVFFFSQDAIRVSDIPFEWDGECIALSWNLKMCFVATNIEEETTNISSYNS